MSKHPAICGDLTITWNEKCSCYSFNLPARLSCPGVEERMKDPKSICRFCYAWSGLFRLPPSAKILNDNLEYVKTHNWTDIKNALVHVITQVPKKDRGYFRFFASGDVANGELARAIVRLSMLLEKTWFWVPTQNRDVYDSIFYPLKLLNLTVRLSTPRINDAAQHRGSCVFTDKPPAKHFVCGGECIKCRACWLCKNDRIAFPFHGNNATVRQLAKARRIRRW